MKWLRENEAKAYPGGIYLFPTSMGFSKQALFERHKYLFTDSDSELTKYAKKLFSPLPGK